MIVADASAVVDALLGRPQALAALHETLRDEPHQPLHAPDLIELEVLNALRRLARSGAVTQQRACEAVADLDDLRLMRHPHAPLRPRVWELRARLSAYDAAYLALAEVLEEPVVVTCDGGLAAVTAELLGRDRVVLAA